MSDIEQTAIEIVTKAVGHTREQKAMAKAIARIAGNVLAFLTTHDEACRMHTERARFHHEKTSRGRR